MTVRTELLLSLRREVLGPKQSSNEILTDQQNPRDEFITGVLLPRDASEEDARNMEGEVETLSAGIEGYDDDEPDEEVPVGASAPVLDPKSQPRSMGISFIVRADDGVEPSVEVCATWARYLPESGPHGQQIYRRVPNCYVTADEISVLTIRGIRTVDQVSLSLRSVPLPQQPSSYKVSIYLVNETSLANPTSPQDKRRVEPADFIFQPQIRVIPGKHTKLLPFDSFRPSAEIPFPGSLEEEDESLALVYRENQAYARGHLCAAVWREIDPERSYENSEENPLQWVDGDIVSQQYGRQTWQKFVLPACRTEYVPCYAIQSPEITWRTGLTNNSPELSAATLAEIWNSQAIRTALQPLVDGYAAWIDLRRSEIPQLENRYQRAAQRHLDSCDRARFRIQEAIDLIVDQDDVRLAFCFANKAINLQASWKQPFENRQNFCFNWRPFQLAFILMNIAAIANPLHSDRNICDLLSFPTGGGKTEAYLGLAAFTLGLRRLRSQPDTHGDRTGQGVSVISRYTLRLLTIQQFRRALGLIVACDVLRVENLGTSRPIGWRPRECRLSDRNIWGTNRFSAGLWVGGNVTSNWLEDKFFPPKTSRLGAISGLAGRRGVVGEPAQILNCPCCNSILAVSKDGLGPGQHIIHLILQGTISQSVFRNNFQPLNEMETVPVITTSSTNCAAGYSTLSIRLTVRTGSRISTRQLDDWWTNQIQPQLNSANLVPFRISRPGYFSRVYRGGRGKLNVKNFEIYCPNPECDLNTARTWGEKVPIRFNQACSAHLQSPDSNAWEIPIEPFAKNGNYTHRVPISAYTVDDQLYARIPSLLVATVDKFARLAFEPKAGALFGNISGYHSRDGYYRSNLGEVGPQTHFKNVNPFQPPDLILQDELHLIEGPLGSMVGAYETAVDTLCQQIYQGQVVVPKYIASTATVRQSQTQVECLFNRQLFQFPPPALSASDNFFALTSMDVHPLQVNEEGLHPGGRLYTAICAPGKGAQTPIVRIYSSLLQRIHELRLAGSSDDACDPYWTLIGYFNAIRELAGASTLYRQDIPERLHHIAEVNGNASRVLGEHVELSSREDSTELPGLLTSLAQSLPDARDIMLSTSMFGTGVDIDRLGLMVVNGQPKTTSSYIQATGRVGRSQGGLVVTFFRASRPRDLDHYEFFTGYHRAIYRYVEPITVTPFAARARERALGPVTVALLRQAIQVRGVLVSPDWAVKTNANRMQTARHSALELQTINQIINERSQAQTETRRPPVDQVDREVRAGLDLWQEVADREPGLIYEEISIDRDPTSPVVLGDEQHQERNFTVIFRNAPQSLREVEGLTRFGSIRNNQQNTGS